MSDAREWLNGRPDAAAVYDEVGDVAWAAQRTIAWDLANAKVMREALLAVLDLHRAIDPQDPSLTSWCDHDGFPWPCATVRAVNKALGVCLCICHEPTTDISPHDGKCRCNGGTGYEAL